MLSILRLISLTGLPRLVYRLVMDRRVPLLTKLILPAAIIYLISPIDLFPDFLTPFGRIDDLLALIAAPILFVALAPRDVVLEHLGRRPGGEDEPSPVETTGKVVDEEEADEQRR